MNNKPPLGEQELETLGFVAERAPISVGAVAKEFGVERGLARTTVMTVMERLRVKGYLSRQRVKGVFVYKPKTDHDDVLKQVVAQFVQRSLGGSVFPFVAYLAETGKLSEAQCAELQAIAEAIGEAEGAKP